MICLSTFIFCSSIVALVSGFLLLIIFPFSGFLLEKDCKYDYNLPISYPMLLTG